MNGASAGARPPFFVLVLFPSLFLSLFFFLVEGKGGRRGTQRRFEHRHSVYIYQNFFAFDRAIAIKMCSCNRCGLKLSFCLCVRVCVLILQTSLPINYA